MYENYRVVICLELNIIFSFPHSIKRPYPFQDKHVGQVLMIGDVMFFPSVLLRYKSQIKLSDI